VLRDDRLFRHPYALPLLHGDTIGADRLGHRSPATLDRAQLPGHHPSRAVFLLQILIPTAISIVRRTGSGVGRWADPD